MQCWHSQEDGKSWGIYVTKYFKDAHYFYCFKVLPVHIYLSNKNNGQEIEEEFNTLVLEKSLFVIYFHTNFPSDSCYIPLKCSAFGFWVNVG